MQRPGRSPRPGRAATVAGLASALLLVSVAAGCGARSDGGDGGGDGGADGSVVSVATGPSVLPGAPEVAARSRLAPVLGATIAGDGRSVDLYAQPVGSGPATAGDLTARAEVRDEAVEVVVERAAPLQPAAPGVGGAAAPPVLCRLEQGLHVLRVPLPGGLGARPVRDLATGATLEPVPLADILRPGALTAGWRLLDERPLREADRQTGWLQRYGPDPAAPGVTVIQRRAALGPSERFAVGRVDRAEVPLRATTAVWSRQADGNAVSLVWTEAGWEVALTSSAGPSAGSTVGPLDRSALEAFAVSLRPDGS